MKKIIGLLLLLQIAGGVYAASNTINVINKTGRTINARIPGRVITGRGSVTIPDVVQNNIPDGKSATLKSYSTGSYETIGLDISDADNDWQNVIWGIANNGATVSYTITATDGYIVAQ